MTTIFIVTSGDYSDYRIEGVFSNKEDAQYLADIVTENYYEVAEVDEWELDAFDKQGIKELCFWDFSYYPKEDKWKCTFHTPETHWSRVAVSEVNKGKQGDEMVYYVTTRGTTREEAQKIANEKIMMTIARGK